jgi:RNA polymerase sigma-70 factor (ECF subfamily)
VDETQLLERLRSGDAGAFVELVQLHERSMLRVARYHVGSAASAEDVVQETWIAALRGLDRFEGRSSLKTWLFSILANRARSVGVREHRSVPLDPGEDTGGILAGRFDEQGAWSEPPAPFEDLVDGRLSDGPLLAAVRAAIEELPDPGQAVVTLRDVEGLPTAEVAQLLDLSEANVRVILHRSRAKVRAAVEEQVREGGRE